MAKGDLRYGNAPIKEVFEHMIKDMGLSQKLNETKVLELIPDLLGSSISKKITERYIHEKKLFLRTHSAPLRNELFIIKDTLLLKIIERVGDKIITEIVIR